MRALAITLLSGLAVAIPWFWFDHWLGRRRRKPELKRRIRALEASADPQNKVR